MMRRNRKRRRGPFAYSTFADELDGAGPTPYGRAAEKRKWQREATGGQADRGEEASGPHTSWA